jgi:hypothetical protein
MKESLPTLIEGGKYRINGFQTETYGYEGVRGFKTVGFRSNAPAGPKHNIAVKILMAVQTGSH